MYLLYTNDCFALHWVRKTLQLKKTKAAGKSRVCETSSAYTYSLVTAERRGSTPVCSCLVAQLVGFETCARQPDLGASRVLPNALKVPRQQPCTLCAPPLRPESGASKVVASQAKAPPDLLAQRLTAHQFSILQTTTDASAIFSEPRPSSATSAIITIITTTKY